MIEEILNNIAYLYYPKGLCATKDYENYIKSNEFKNLSTTLNKSLAEGNFKKSRIDLLNRIKEYQSFKDIKDITLDQHDRCLTFETEVIEDSRLIKICLNISLLIPFYHIYTLSNDIEIVPKYKWLNLPRRDEESEKKFSKEIKLLEEIIECQIKFSRFPDYLVEKVIPEINYVDIELGDFTFYNAFFLDDIN